VDGGWRVKLYADRAPIDFVKVLLFKDFSQLPNADQLLKTPPVSDLLPAPVIPKVDASTAASASAGSASAAASVTAPVAAPTGSVTKPAVVKPKPKPAAPAQSSASAASLKPFMPPAASSASSPATGGDAAPAGGAQR